jgi:type II secretory pathway pseudopilin PulG
MRTSERGFSYLLLLFALVLGGVLLAATGEHWQVLLQREREAELLFRGGEIRRALQSYHATAVDGVARYPETLADLLEDRREAPPQHHLRRLYLDPFTGAADWLLLRDADGRISGVHSRTRLPALRREGVPAAPSLTGETSAAPEGRVGDWWFVAEDAAETPR